MARIDKLWVGFRALAGTVLTGIKTVEVRAGGSVFPIDAAGEGDGIICLPGTHAAGRPVTVIQRGEIVEFSGGVAGVEYFGQADATLGTANAGGERKVGKTVEADRLIVQM